MLRRLRPVPVVNRRQVLGSVGVAAGAGALSAGHAAILSAVPDNTGLNPQQLPDVRVGDNWQFLHEPERQAIQAIFDRLIPADAHGPSASEAGCVAFLDAQLAGAYGAGRDLYLVGPLAGDESELMGRDVTLRTRRDHYRTGLAALSAHCRQAFGAEIARLPAARLDALIAAMESGDVDLGSGVDARAFFELMLQNVREGYFADPLYGGNRDMAGWKMVGFPGARYDYRPYMDRRGDDLGLEPVSLLPAE